MKKENQNKKVFVGLSGGVDSSVAALRLKNDGYQVYGVFIKVWHPDWLKCNWEAERLDAMRVAAKLDIPFLTCDAEAAYRDDVAKYFISEYQAGRTPNPDVMCNKHVKFGAFLRFAEAKGADYVATGHYAQRLVTENFYELHRGNDSNKDQSYFLWTLKQQQLSKTLFPVGNSPKETIRKEAEQAGLLTAEKKDSQGVCFLGHIDIAEFLSHYTELKTGDVLNENGEVIGSHKGALIYTTGQRHGFTTSTKEDSKDPYYVIGRDLNANTITVSHKQPTLAASSELKLTDLNLITPPEKLLDKVEIQTRYRQTPQPAQVTDFTADTMTLNLLGEGESVSSGQSCVLYQGTKCLGGGIIV